MTLDLDILSDRLNPIVVKEVRQGLRSRTFTVSFALLLVACVIISLAVWDKPSDGERLGRDAFEAFFMCLGVVGFLVIPVQSFRSLSAELATDAWQAMTLSSLTARQVLRGKIASQLVQGMLYASATAPFLLFSYFLQGVALVSVLAVLVLAILWQAALVTFAAAVATFGVGRFARGLAGAVAIGGSILAFSGATALAARLVENPADMLAGDSLLGIGLWAVFLLTFLAIVFELAAGRLAPSSANVAGGPRLAALVHLAVLGLAVAFVQHERDEVAFALFGWGSALLFALGAYGMGEPDAPPRAVREKRPLFGMFVPGALRAFRFAMIGELLLAAALALTVDPTQHPAGLAVYLAAPALFAIYLSFAAILTRGVPHLFGAPLAARAASYATLGVGTALPMLVGVLGGGQLDDPDLNFLNPVLAFAQGLSPGADGMATSGAPARFVLAVALAIAADRLLARREGAAAHG